MDKTTIVSKVYALQKGLSVGMDILVHTNEADVVQKLQDIKEPYPSDDVLKLNFNQGIEQILDLIDFAEVKTKLPFLVYRWWDEETVQYLIIGETSDLIRLLNHPEVEQYRLFCAKPELIPGRNYAIHFDDKKRWTIHSLSSMQQAIGEGYWKRLAGTGVFSTVTGAFTWED